MGVPAFYRWLSLKYPKIIVDLLEKRSIVVGGEEIPLNLLEPNPNGIEYDNLYIDMNGLIHPCSHPEDREAPLTEAEMYVNVTKYVDRLFSAIRPRRLLFLAIDGVAPRAKMNQQRARRFRAAQEASERAETMNEVIAEMESLGLTPPPSSGNTWDSNVITPGTEFMDRLSLYLKFYILDRMNRNPAWRKIKVILSDASEPGEGEHKIMKFIRSQRSQPGYDPNQKHILHGLDADLIMLGLATHEPHFTILREEVTYGGKKKDNISEAKRMLAEESAAIASLKPEDEWVYSKPLQCLHIKVLREYLDYEFNSLKHTLPFTYDLERIIDDFVFICFFVGNDFLPHLPSLDIRDGAIDFLIEVYKELLPSMGNYVTSPGGVVNLQQADVLLSKVGEVEDEVFQRRKAAEDRETQRNKRSYNNNNTNNTNNNLNNRRIPTYDEHYNSFKQQNNNYDNNNNYNYDNNNNNNNVETPLQLQSQPQSNLSAALNLRNKLGKLSQKNNNDLEDTTIESLSGNKRSLVESQENNEISSSELSIVLTVPVIEKDNIDQPIKVPKLSTTEVSDIQIPLESSSPSSSLIEPLESSLTTILPLESNNLNDNQEVIELVNEKQIEEQEQIEVKIQIEGDGDIGDIGDAVDVIDDVDPTIDLDEEPRLSTLPVNIITSMASNESDNSKKNVLVDYLKKRIDEKQKKLIEENKVTIKDVVKFHERGWKERYYGDKYKKEDIEKNGGLSVMFYEYIKGLCWVLKYYYQGCPSWNWYYPFHYAPFASDLINIDSYQISFELSHPFRPVEQLLAVLPADSVQAVPECFHQLMLSPNSPIIDLYSRDIPIDPNGKILPWLWVVLLPFIDENRIISAVKLYENEMTEEEKRRNSFGFPLIFVDKDHLLGNYLQQQQQLQTTTTTTTHDNNDDNSNNVDNNDNKNDKGIYFSSDIGNGICGKLSINDDIMIEYGVDKFVKAPDRPVRAFESISSNRIYCLRYEFPEELAHVSRLLENVDLGDKILSDYDGIAHRPKLNKGKFNIADIAERMRDEKARQSAQRMILAGIGMTTNMSHDYTQNFQGGGQSFNQNYHSKYYNDNRQSSSSSSSSYINHQSAEFQQFNRRNEFESNNQRQGNNSYDNNDHRNLNEYNNNNNTRYSSNNYDRNRDRFNDRERYDNINYSRSSYNNYDRDRDYQHSRNTSQYQKDDRTRDEYSPHSYSNSNLSGNSNTNSNSNSRYSFNSRNTQNSWNNNPLNYSHSSNSFNQYHQQQLQKEQQQQQTPQPFSWRQPPPPPASVSSLSSSLVPQQLQQEENYSNQSLSRAPPLPNMFSHDPRLIRNNNSSSDGGSRSQISNNQINYTNSRDPRMRR